jgi:hypothetical protein
MRKIAEEHVADGVSKIAAVHAKGLAMFNQTALVRACS